MKLIVMIPAYNEEATIASVIKKIPRELKNISEVKILVTDDGSTDKTISVSKKAGADHIVAAHRNQGLGKNFKKGLEACLKLKADIIVNIDADGQFNPLDITKLIKPILSGKADMVTASRFSNSKYAKSVPFMKRIGNWGFSKLVSFVTGERFSDTQCGYRAYTREAALRLNLFGRFTYTQEVFIDLVSKGMTIKAVPLPVKYFAKRKSAISGKLIAYGFKSLGIIANASRDTRPMDFFGRPGFTILALGLLGGLVSFFYWITHLMTSPIETLFQVSVFFMVFGLLLIIFGLLADMMKRIKLTQEEILYRLKKKEYS